VGLSPAAAAACLPIIGTISLSTRDKCRAHANRRQRVPAGYRSCAAALHQELGGGWGVSRGDVAIARVTKTSSSSATRLALLCYQTGTRVPPAPCPWACREAARPVPAPPLLRHTALSRAAAPPPPPPFRCRCSSAIRCTRRPLHTFAGSPSTPHMPTSRPYRASSRRL